MEKIKERKLYKLTDRMSLALSHGSGVRNLIIVTKVFFFPYPDRPMQTVCLVSTKHLFYGQLTILSK